MSLYNYHNKQTVNNENTTTNHPSIQIQITLSILCDCVSGCKEQHEADLQMSWCFRFMLSEDMLACHVQLPAGRRVSQGQIRRCKSCGDKEEVSASATGR